MARPVRLQIEPLEARDVPTVAANLAGGVLSILGGPDRDRIDVTLDAAQARLVVRDHGRVVGSFASAAVASISIATGAGEDAVRVAPNVTQPTAIDGGADNDLLIAGGGP